VPGSSSHTGPGFLWVVGRAFYFAGPAPNRGLQLWRSDGTSRGTTTLTNLVPRPGSPQAIFSISILGSRLFFVADTKSMGQELWVTDGTAKGTRALTSFAPPEAFFASDFSSFVLLPQQHLGNRMVFPVDDGVHGTELWTTDGTPGGTRLLMDICPGACEGASTAPVPNGGLSYFTASDGVSGHNPWVTDGTPAGTRRILDLCGGSCSSFPFAFEPAGRWVYFQATVGGQSQIWRTNGTARGTVPLASYRIPPPSASSPVGLQRLVLGRSLLFASSSAGEVGLELWRSDGTPQGTRLLGDLNTRDLGGSYPKNLTAAGDRVYFFAYDGQDEGIWRSDGTEAGTSPVFDPSLPGGDPEFNTRLLEVGGTLFAQARFGERVFALWRLDGSGPVRLTPEGIDARSEVMLALGSTLFFAARDEDHGQELWTSDGTAAGTRLAVDLEPGFRASEPEILAVFKGNLYFTAGVEATGRELWRTDGTAAGTVLMTDIPSSYNSEVNLLTEHGDRLWFFATDYEHGRELWSTDGTPQGTRLHELVPGPDGLGANRMVWAGERLFLFGDGGVWLSDGTAGGTHQISDLRPASNTPFDPTTPVALDGTVYFSASIRGSADDTLWKSDGTQAGTVQVLDRAGLPVSRPEFFLVFAGKVFLLTENEGKIFQTDGTAAGTFPVLDVGGPLGAGFPELVRAGSRLFFDKWDRETGIELWALEEN
jgi:large repetitive protein